MKNNNNKKERMSLENGKVRTIDRKREGERKNLRRASKYNKNNNKYVSRV